MKGLDQNRQLLAGHLSATELRKITLMSTEHHIRLSAGENRFDLLLRPGLKQKPSPNNNQPRIK
jgi:hypothetical protein